MSEVTSDSPLTAAMLAARARSDMGGHPGLDRLLDYHAGRLEPDAEKLVQVHVVGCRSCARMLLELEPLARPDTTEDAVADLELEGSLRRFEVRLGAAPESTTSHRFGWRTGRFSPGFLQAVAAALLLTAVALTAWVARLHGTAAELRRGLDALSMPRPNVAVVSLEATADRGPAAEPIALRSGEPFWALLLLPPDPRPRPEYEVVLLRADGAEIWQGRGFEMNEDGAIPLWLTRRILPTGEYRLHLSGLDGSQRTFLAEYSLRVEPE